MRRARNYGIHRFTARCGKSLGCYIGRYRRMWHESLHDCMSTHEAMGNAVQVTCIIGMHRRSQNLNRNDSYGARLTPNLWETAV